MDTKPTPDANAPRPADAVSFPIVPGCLSVAGACLLCSLLVWLIDANPMPPMGMLVTLAVCSAAGVPVFLFALVRRPRMARAHAAWYLVAAPFLSFVGTLVAMIVAHPSGAEGGVQAAAVWVGLQLAIVPSSFVVLGVLRWLVSRRSSANPPETPAP